jgi:hypothetical protein
MSISCLRIIPTTAPETTIYENIDAVLRLTSLYHYYLDCVNDATPVEGEEVESELRESLDEDVREQREKLDRVISTYRDWAQNKRNISTIPIVEWIDNSYFSISATEDVFQICDGDFGGGGPGPSDVRIYVLTPMC